MISDLMMQKALDRYHAVGVAGLTEQEKTLAAIWCFESKVANGGFEHFYRSAEGDLASFAPTAFQNVGAQRLAVIAERANAVFGAAGVPVDRRRRADVLERVPAARRGEFDDLERAYADYEKDLDRRVEEYLEHAHGPS